jgi:hypothetical protein
VGVDFINKVGRSFEKHLDLARARLGTADLFSRSPIEDCPTFPVDLAPRAKVAVRAELTAEVDGRALVFRSGLEVVARMEAPPADILRAVEGSSGIATAIVQDVHELSAVAEVTLC